MIGTVKEKLQEMGLGQQLALTASTCCLLVSLALVVLASLSSQHLLQTQQSEYGTALAQQIASRLGSALETGNLLSVAASLQRFVATSPAEQVAIFDVEGKALGQAGQPRGTHQQQYRAPVHIASDVAGEVVITLNTDRAQAGRWRFVMSLLGLAGLLSGLVYVLTLQLGQRLARSLRQLRQRIALEEHRGETRSDNEVGALAQEIAALPMDLLRARNSGGPRDDDYASSAVLYLHLTSLVDYVDTLDEQALQRYTDRLHQVVYAAAGFYGGRIQVMRQFGLAIFFSGQGSAGTAAFRAASCGWLIQAVCRDLEDHMSLSLGIAMAVAHSELGLGDESDIYPGLYIQHTLDELQAVCASRPPRVMLSPAICEDVDVSGRLLFHPSELGGYAILEQVEGPYDDLLERQLQLILRRLSGP
jgi:HAMP domain-containing protein